MVFEQSWWELSQMYAKGDVKSLVTNELILVSIWLSQVGWIGFLCLASKIGEKVKSWFLCNLGGELSQMHPK